MISYVPCLEEIAFGKKLAAEFFRRYARGLLEFEDVQATALLALCASAQAYDPNLGACFTTFSYLRIRGALFRMLNRRLKTERCFHHSRSDMQRNEQGDTAAEQQQSTLGCESGYLVPEQAGFAVRGTGSFGQELEVISIDAKTPEEDCEYLGLKRLLAKIISVLPEQESKVIWYHYFEDQTFEEIGALLGGRSKSWVSTYHMRAMDILREAFKDWER